MPSSKTSRITFVRIPKKLLSISAVLALLASVFTAAPSQALEQRLASVENTTASISRPWSQRQREKAGAAAAPPPSLNAAEARAWQKLQQGRLDINSEEGKIFSRLGDAKLAALGITKGKDNAGVDIYQYKAPSFSNTEVEERIRQQSAYRGGTVASHDGVSGAS